MADGKNALKLDIRAIVLAWSRKRPRWRPERDAQLTKDEKVSYHWKRARIVARNMDARLHGKAGTGSEYRAENHLTIGNILMTFRVPEEVETKRLKLRLFREDDWRDLHELYGDEEATRFTLGRVLSEGESWRTMASMIGHWQIRGYGPYAAEEKSSGKVIGPMGFWYPNDWPFPEIKYALARKFWGNGYAREASLAIQRVAAQYLPDISLISFIHADNAASIKLARAINATLEKEVDFRGAKWMIFRHPKVMAGGNEP